MSASFLDLSIPGAFLAEPETFPDNRGRFLESWSSTAYEQAGVGEVFVQDSLSYSLENVLRGMHFQIGNPQGQMVTVVKGRILDVIADLRRGSPTFLKTEMFEIDSKRLKQIFMPPGVAHGFFVLSDEAILHYKATRYYQAKTQRGVRWDDPDLAISWPDADPLLSERDAVFPLIREMEDEDFPVFHPADNSS